MLQPISALLEAVDGQLPRELVSVRALKALKRRAARVPSAWVAGCVECRIDGNSDQSDLLVYATRGSGAQEHLADILVQGGGREFGRARSLLAHWSRSNSLLGRELSTVWLEYDLPVDGSEPEPFVFICLYPDYLADGRPRHVFGRPISVRRTKRVAAAGLREALGQAPDPSMLELLAQCAARLPRHGRMFHVVGMPHRPSTDLRIGVILPTAGLASWLAAVGWPGRKRQLELLQRVLGGGTELLHVQLDLRDRIRPRLSVDFEGLVPSARSRRWTSFVERLVDTGCCQRDCALAAVRWLKSRPVRLPGETLPLRVDQQLFFKVTSDSDSIEAKAYLLFQPRHALL